MVFFSCESCCRVSLLSMKTFTDEGKRSGDDNRISPDCHEQLFFGPYYSSQKIRRSSPVNIFCTQPMRTCSGLSRSQVMSHSIKCGFERTHCKGNQICYL